MFKCIKYVHHAFEELIFVHLSNIIVLYCIIHMIRNYRALIIKLSIYIILLHIGRYRVTTDIYMHCMLVICYTVKDDVIDLHYNI